MIPQKDNYFGREFGRKFYYPETGYDYGEDLEIFPRMNYSSNTIEIEKPDTLGNKVAKYVAKMIDAPKDAIIGLLKKLKGEK